MARPRSIRLFVPYLPGVILGAAVTWFCGLGPGSSASRLQAAGPGLPETNGTMALTTTGPGTQQRLFLIDTRTQALAVYLIDPQNTKGTLKLEAARQYRWDMKLAEYNNASPDVTAVESMVGGSRR
jgi:hypothetical protein